MTPPLDWLLDSDPALRWQVERDLAGRPEAVWRATRARVATEGFGARLLAHQDADGRWAGGAYFPADATRGEPQPWTATTWSLNALREWGVDAAALGDTATRLATNARWEYDDLPYWGGEVDCCVNAWTLANGAWLGADVAPLLDWFAAHRMADGGWNCDWVEGATRTSFHSTLNVLAGLLEWQRITGDSTAALRAPAERYLLERHLLRRRSTGEPHEWALRWSFPFRWRYSVPRALDHFRAAGVRDPRLAEAVDVLRAARGTDGRWPQGHVDAGRVWFDIDAPEGRPSKWLTLVGARVLDWWEG